MITDIEFDGLLESSLSELENKQSYLEREFELGHYERFFIDYTREEIQFFRDDQVALSFSITAIGSHSPEKQSWRWAWANESLPDYVRTKALRTQQLFELTGFELFRQPDVSVDESMAWEFVALCCKVLGALGMYSMPQGHLKVYVVLDSPTKHA